MSNDVEVGQRYRVIPAFAGKAESNEAKRQIGRVIYINRKGRYALLEFEGQFGKPRECFPLELLTWASRIKK